MLRESLAGYGVDTSERRDSAWRAFGRGGHHCGRRGRERDHRGAGGERRGGPRDLVRLAAALDGAWFLLLQLEVPLDAVVAAAEPGASPRCDGDPGSRSAQPLPETLYAAVDILTPNESEAAVLVGFPLDDPDAIADGRAKQSSLTRWCGARLVKLGVKASSGAMAGQSVHFPVLVAAGHSVGVGDAFNVGLAAGSERWRRHGRGRHPAGDAGRRALLVMESGWELFDAGRVWWVESILSLSRLEAPPPGCPTPAPVDVGSSTGGLVLMMIV